MTLAEFVNVIGFRVDQGDINDVNRTMAGIKSKAQNLLGKIGIGLSIYGISNAIKECVALASEAEEMQNKFNVVFQGMNDTVEDWARNYANSIGRSANDIKTYLADAQNLMVGFMGQDRREDAYEMSKSMTKMAMDLASFNNINENIAINAMQKAVMGETESAKTLGAVLNDVTRAEAMATLGLEGKYEALDQATKMQVNYQAIVNQSKDAIDDCERSINSYRSTLIAFQSRLKDIKTMIGQFFMPAAQKVLKFGTWMLGFLERSVVWLNRFAEKVGGSERILATLAAAMAAFFLYQKWGRIVDGARAFLSVMKGLNIQTALTFAKFLLFALLVEDFIGFLQGKRSIFGTMLEKAGIDADNVRNAVVSMLNSIKDALASLSENGELVKIIAIAALAVGAIGSIVKAVSTAMKVFTLFKGAFTAFAGAKAAGGILAGLKAAMIALAGPAGAVVIAILAVLAAGIALYKNWDTIKAKASDLYQKGSQAFQNLQTSITNKANAIREKGNAAISGFFSDAKADFLGIYNSGREFFSSLSADTKARCNELYQNGVDAFHRLKGGIFDTCSSIYSAVYNGFQAALDYITYLPSKAYTWGADIISNLVNGIRDGVGKVKEAVTNVATSIRERIGFSVPEIGPLSDFDTYMPDMIDLLVRGINDGEDPVGAAITRLTSMMSTMIHAANLSTATTAGIYNNTNNRSVTQNVNFTNTFHGDAATQRNASRTMKRASKDTTAELARGLSYV